MRMRICLDGLLSCYELVYYCSATLFCVRESSKYTGILAAPPPRRGVLRRELRTADTSWSSTQPQQSPRRALYLRSWRVRHQGRCDEVSGDAHDSIFYWNPMGTPRRSSRDPTPSHVDFHERLRVPAGHHGIASTRTASWSL